MTFDHSTYIQVRKLFKGGNYSRAEGIFFQTVRIIGTLEYIVSANIGAVTYQLQQGAFVWLVEDWLRPGTRRCPDRTVVGIGFAISSHSAARGRFENGSHCCMWSDRRSRDAGYHHAVSTRRPEKFNRIRMLVKFWKVYFFIQH